MAISRVAGNLLADNLQRGNNLSIQGNLAFFDVGNSRVGILTATPQDQLDVIGTANATNVRVTSATANGVVFASNDQLLITDANLSFDGDVLTVVGNIDCDTLLANSLQVGNIDVGNIVSTGLISGEYIYGNTAINSAGNITGNNLVSNNAVTSQTANITGNIDAGNVYVINDFNLDSAAANAVIFTDADKNLISSANLLFDGSALILLGSANVDNLSLDGNTISSDTELTIVSGADSNVTIQLSGNGVAKIDATTSLTLPVGNTAQRPSSPDLGAIRYNDALGRPEFWDGAEWVEIVAEFAQIINQQLIGDGSTVLFTLDRETTTAAIIVSINGTVQEPDVAYTVVLDEITFAEAPQISDIIDIRFISITTTVNAIANSPGTSELRITNPGVADASSAHSLQLPSYTVAQATVLGNVASGQLIYVTNGDSGSPCLAVYSGGSWKRVSLGATISS